MVRNSVLSVLILLMSLSGFSQNKDNKTEPNEDIKVNKEFDKDGNLIRYDSTYVYTWSSDSCYTSLPDSAFLNFSDIHKIRKKMQEQLEQFYSKDSSKMKQFYHPFFSDDFFDNSPFDSEFFQNDFYSEDSIPTDMFRQMEKMWEERKKYNREHNTEMRKNLDSLRNSFMLKRKEYFQQRDSIYRFYQQENKSTDL
ncbi:hypothetical protein [Labilibaculum sp.]|uniref:hypothetical protein n=1 Tax=Labilibaculum sp. TaxID=2060723 RepID=UPI0035693858